MTIKDTPKGLPDSALDFPKEAPESEYSDVIEYMEKTYPQMTSEFKKITFYKDSILFISI